MRFPDGSEGPYGVVDKADFALIVPRHPDGRFEMVEQFRYPVGARHWEFPQGSWEASPDADPEALARGELEEETGLRAMSIRPLGHLFEAYGFSNQGFHVFLAEDFERLEPARDTTEQDMATGTFALEDIAKMVASRQIKDAPSLAALTLLRLDAGST